MFQLKTMRGFSLIELMIGVAILGFLAAIGMPAMTNWMVTNKARSASDFYTEGLGMARRQAIVHNARARLILTPNADNGQLDWQVDLCFPSPGVPCTNTSGAWSTTTDVAVGDPEGATGFKSIFRSAQALPSSSVLVPSILPAGASAIYFTEVGWVDTTLNNLNRILLTPATDYASNVPEVAVVVTLAGMTSKCDPTKIGTDSRACPPSSP